MDRSMWEYLFVKLDLASGERMQVRWINDVELEQWKRNPPLHDHLNQLGTEGWELVTIGLFGTRHQTLVFKRPKG